MSLDDALRKSYPKGYSGYFSNSKWKRIRAFLEENKSIDDSISFAVVFEDRYTQGRRSPKPKNILMFTGDNIIVWRGSPYLATINIGNIVVAKTHQSFFGSTVIKLRYGTAMGFYDESWVPPDDWNTRNTKSIGIKIENWIKDAYRFPIGKTNTVHFIIMDDNMMRLGKQFIDEITKLNSYARIEID